MKVRPKETNANLYNVVYKKSSRVIDFITNLYPPDWWSQDKDGLKRLQRFYDVKAKALSQLTPDSMLDIIGYDKSGKRQHKIYEV
jgi:hypothetical protein